MVRIIGITCCAVVALGALYFGGTNEKSSGQRNIAGESNSGQSQNVFCYWVKPDGSAVPCKGKEFAPNYELAGTSYSETSSVGDKVTISLDLICTKRRVKGEMDVTLREWCAESDSTPGGIYKISIEEGPRMDYLITDGEEELLREHYARTGRIDAHLLTLTMYSERLEPYVPQLPTDDE